MNGMTSVVTVPPKAVDVEITDDTLTVDLEDGRTISVKNQMKALPRSKSGLVKGIKLSNIRSVSYLIKQLRPTYGRIQLTPN